MSKDELSAAQFFLGVHQHALNLARRLDPFNRHEHPTVIALDSVAAEAGGAFLMMTHKLPASVQPHELSWDHPAPWTHDVGERSAVPAGASP